MKIRELLARVSWAASGVVIIAFFSVWGIQAQHSGDTNPFLFPWSYLLIALFSVSGASAIILALLKTKPIPPDTEINVRDSDFDEYRRRSERSWQRANQDYVPLTTELTTGQANFVPLGDLLNQSAYCIVLSAPSGYGKSTVARDAALQLSRLGRMVLWIAAGDYEPQGLDLLLARGSAPYSALPARQLLHEAVRSGKGATLIIDGFNECPASIREEFLDELAALRQVDALSLLVTTTDADATLIDGAHNITLRAPSASEREELLSSFGLADGADVPSAFATPLELSLAAQCVAELRQDSSPAQLFDIYIRRIAPSEITRSGLRAAAAHLNVQLRSSATRSELVQVLRRAGELNSSQIDSTLSNRLLAEVQGRFRFAHEQFERFLAAESLVLSARDGTELGMALLEPHNAHLKPFALNIESSSDRVIDALRTIADESLFALALRATFGTEVQAALSRDCISLIRRVELDATAASFSTADVDSEHGAFWTPPMPWSDLDTALLSAVGRSIAHGHFATELEVLLDATEDACRSRSKELVTLREQERNQRRGRRDGCLAVAASGSRFGCVIHRRRALSRTDVSLARGPYGSPGWRLLDQSTDVSDASLRRPVVEPPLVFSRGRRATT